MPLRSAQPQERTRKEARFSHLRTMTPIIADRESGKPLFCAVWMLPLQALTRKEILLARYHEGCSCGEHGCKTDPHHEADCAYDIRLPHLGFGNI